MNNFLWNKAADKIKNMKKADWLILFLFGVLLLVMALPVNSKATEQNTTTNPLLEESNDSGPGEAEWEDYRRGMEQELAELLSDMEGAGRVRVMITLQDGGEDFLEKDIKSSGESYETDTVIFKNEKKESPYVSKRTTPRVDGVVVLVQGGNRAQVAANISDAIQALFGIEAHKIKIVKMAD